MKRTSPSTWVLLGLGGVAACAAGLAATSGTFVDAADHLDPPARVDGDTGDREADIGDIYAWHRGSGADRSLVAVLTFDGPNAPTADQDVPCDPNVLYTIQIDSDADRTADHSIRARFGEDDVGNCFVRVEGIPGVTGPIDAAVGTARTVGSTHVYAGLQDDPFFFDLQGFRETLMMGTLRFDPTRDSFAGQNISAIVVEFPLSAIGAGDQVLDVWATTGRVGS